MARKIQNEDVKTAADLTGAGGTIDQLINASKIYDSDNAQALQDTLHKNNETTTDPLSSILATLPSIHTPVDSFWTTTGRFTTSSGGFVMHLLPHKRHRSSNGKFFSKVQLKHCQYNGDTSSTPSPLLPPRLRSIRFARKLRCFCNCEVRPLESDAMADNAPFKDSGF